MEMAAVKYQLRFVREKLKDMKKKRLLQACTQHYGKAYSQISHSSISGKKKKKKSKYVAICSSLNASIKQNHYTENKVRR